ncbi:MAG: aspartate dehydrogenase [Methanolobus sp.]|nr:aspartate dehydrogenase [Methanolobus sp.]
MFKIGLVGCGTIGTTICKAIDDGTVEAQLFAIYDRNTEDVERLLSTLRKEKPLLMETSEMIQNIDLLIECASQEAVPEVIPLALKAHCDVMIMSVGAFADNGLFTDIRELAKDNNCKVYLPSGAIVGLDGLKSASVEDIYSVTLTTKKPPQGLEGAPYITMNDIDLESIEEETLLFEGAAIEAVRAFPANVNVAATISIAGIGFEKTRVRIVADPKLTRNIHEICVEGAFGKFTTRAENLPSPTNPKSSYLASLSAIATLKRITDPFQTGT